MSCEQVDYSTPPCNVQDHIIPCFCSSVGPNGDELRIAGCNSLGVPGEWVYEAGLNLQCKHWANNPTLEGGSIAGYRATCKRNSYKGSIEECCSEPGACFSSNGGTCDPEARSYTGKLCQQNYLKICSDTNLNNLKELWSPGGVCQRALEANSLAGNNAYVADLGSALLGSYFQNFPVSESPSDLQNLIYDICIDNPLACSRYLENITCPRYTREDLVNLPEARKFCGCNLSDDQYITDQSVLGGAGRECDSICISTQNVRPVNSAGDALYCQKTICIIDNISIDLLNSTLGGINFSQLCGDCGSGGCLCIIKDVDINAEESEIGGINLSQECGNQQCYQTSSNGEVVEVDCDLAFGDRQQQAEDESGASRKWLWIGLGIGLGILILIIIIIFIIFAMKKS